MKTLKNNAASMLYEKAKSIGKERPDSWRCIHLKCPSTEQNQPLRSSFVLRIASDLLADEDGYIYHCSDGDIFILFQGALMPILRKLGGKFDDFRHERLDNVMEQEHIGIFDLRMQWPDFYEICYNKALKNFPATQGTKALPAHS
jgi:hypothetical protein